MSELIAEIVRRYEDRWGHWQDSIKHVTGTEPAGQDAGEDMCFTIALRLADDLDSDDPEIVNKAVGFLLPLLNLLDPADLAGPLGRAIAMTPGQKDREISRALAGRILGVSRGQVYNLVKAGKLEQGAGSVARQVGLGARKRAHQGVTWGSVARRLGARRSHREPIAPEPGAM